MWKKITAYNNNTGTPIFNLKETLYENGNVFDTVRSNSAGVAMFGEPSFPSGSYVTIVADDGAANGGPFATAQVTLTTQTDYTVNLTLAP